MNNNLRSDSGKTMKLSRPMEMLENLNADEDISIRKLNPNIVGRG